MRSNLWKGSESLRAEAKDVRLVFDKRVVDGVSYCPDPSKDMSGKRVRKMTEKNGKKENA